MAILTLAIFVEAFPELNDPTGLDTLQNTTLLSLLDEVEGVHITTTAFFGIGTMTLRLGTTITRTQMAQLLLTAHFYTGLRFNARHGSNAVGQVTSRNTQDGETLSFSTLTFSSSQNKVLSTTGYGLRLINLKIAGAACLGGFATV